MNRRPAGMRSRRCCILYVADVDATYGRAIEAGGVSLRPPTDMYYGDRVACVRDPSENDWWIATRLDNPPIGEIQERAEAFLKARIENSVL
jgi:PhnB protein